VDTVAEPATDETPAAESTEAEKASSDDDEGAEAEVDLSGLGEMAEAQPEPQPAGQTGRRESPTMNLKIPSFAKEDREPVEVAAAGLEAIDQIIKHAADSGFPDVCLAVGQPPWARTGQGFVPMPGWPDVVSERALRSMVGGLLEPAEKRRLQTHGNVSFAYGQVGEYAQVRCTVFRQGNGVTAVLRIPLLDGVDPDVLGVPEGTVEMVGRSGLVVVASRPGGGRTTTAFALGAVLAESTAGLSMAVGRPLERLLTHARPVLNVEVGRHAPSAAAALDGALSCGVLVAVVEDPGARGVQKAVELARSGLTVVLTLRAASAIDGLGRLVNLATGDSSAGIDRVTITQVLKCVLYQELLPRSGKGAVAAFERLRPSSTTIAAVQDGRWELVGGRYGRTVTSPGLETTLKELVGRGTVDLKVADAVIERRKAGAPVSGPDK
jgi:Tfp pilus assembly pilus retraction ATPase PilT